MQEDFSKYNGEGTVLRKAQTRMLDILIEVDKICRKHDIAYWLDGGTCLGAVRHKGFIPWDDDIDIAVMRNDYKRLRNILKRELPANMAFQDETTEKRYPSKQAKVRDRNSCFEEAEIKATLKEQGIFIDIFPIEKGYVKVKTFIDFFYGRAFRRLRRHAGNKKEYIAALMMWPFACAMVGAARFFNFLIPAGNLIYGYGIPTLNKYQLRAEDFFPTKPVLFENHEFMAPANPDAYLKLLYGDYMQIPPKEKRRVHASTIKFFD
ncbi:MAG: LicD family protein [Prevotella sp.]|jgi:lipopolysaccharide cholinephosphotransferase|nr:LicD family protein [Prevotella sp.]